MLEDIIKILVFQIGMQHFGLEIKTLAGVLPVKKDIGIPNAKCPNGSKVIDVNHNIAPVLDLHEKLQISPLVPIENMLIVLSSNGRMLAVPIERTEAIYSVSQHNLCSVPITVQNKGRSIIKKIAVLEERLIPLLASEQLFLLLSESEGNFITESD